MISKTIRTMKPNNRVLRQSREHGFTIVELLIVIVVIGILAAISIVSYNGIQSRATTAQKQTTIRNIEKQAEIFKVTDDTYPNSTQMEDLDLGQNVEILPFIRNNTSIIYNKGTIYTAGQHYSYPTTQRVDILQWNDSRGEWVLSQIFNSSSGTTRSEDEVLGSNDQPFVAMPM